MNDVPDRGHRYSVAEAEELTGITKQQLSRWRKRLQDVPKYRERQILAACRKAELIPAENHLAEGTGDPGELRKG
jgi:hypothetical protein